MSSRSRRQRRIHHAKKSGAIKVPPATPKVFWLAMPGPFKRPARFTPRRVNRQKFQLAFYLRFRADNSFPVIYALFEIIDQKNLEGTFMTVLPSKIELSSGPRRNASMPLLKPCVISDLMRSINVSSSS